MDSWRDAVCASIIALMFVALGAYLIGTLWLFSSLFGQPWMLCGPLLWAVTLPWMVFAGSILVDAMTAWATRGYEGR